MNYDVPLELHDYRYLGSNFRERERIRRQQRRWAGKLARMKPLQRYALLAAIAGEESRPAGGTYQCANSPKNERSFF
jgi:hypothetical protein